MKSFILTLLILLGTQVSGFATSTTTYDKEQLKRDYKVFLEQLKVLNAQYKEITGEIGQVMKEEGVPAWDMGEGLDVDAKTDTPKVEDLGGGAYLKNSPGEMALTVDLPGFKKESIKLNFKDPKTITLKAERKLETGTKTFERSFDLPVPGDPKNTSAAYADGVLTVKIRKIASQEVSVPVR